MTLVSGNGQERVQTWEQWFGGGGYLLFRESCREFRDLWNNYWTVMPILP